MYFCKLYFLVFLDPTRVSEKVQLLLTLQADSGLPPLILNSCLFFLEKKQPGCILEGKCISAVYVVNKRVVVQQIWAEIRVPLKMRSSYPVTVD